MFKDPPIRVAHYSANFAVSFATSAPWNRPIA
jgi:hypothetical protein